MRNVLKESCEQNSIPSCINCNLVKPFEYQLIRMLENQGTSVVKESMSNTEASNRKRADSTKRSHFVGRELKGETLNSNEIVLSFNSAISEVVDVIPSLKSIQYAACNQKQVSPFEDQQEDFLRTHRLSRSLSISLIDTATIDRNQAQVDH